MAQDDAFGWTGYVPLDGIVSGPLHDGVVREWLDEQGWGVIDCAATPGGCRVHFSAIVSGGYRSLDRGAAVRLTVERAQQDGYSYRAVQVWPAGVEVGSIPEPQQDSSGAYQSTLTITGDGEHLDAELVVREQDRQLAQERLIILDAFVTALDHRNEVSAIISEAENDEVLREQLAATLGITEIGATAILDLQLRRFSRQAAERIRRERDELATMLESR